MAQKAILNISNYSGGLNNETTPRDIEVNQFQDIDSLSIDIPGKLTVMGATAEEGTTLTIPGSTFTPIVGDGLFYFKSDKDPEQTTNATDNTEMLFINDRADTEIKIFDKTDGAYSAKTIDYGPVASDVEFTAIDGDVRVTATDFSNDNMTPKVFTFLNEACDYGNTFAGTNFPRVDRVGWYVDNATVDAPTTNEIKITHDDDNSNLSGVVGELASGATLATAITSTSQNDVVVSDGSKFSADTYIKIGSEILYVSSISSNTLTTGTNATGRGRYSSSAATHLVNVAISYLQKSPINGEILRIPSTVGTHSGGTGPLIVNFFLGKESVFDSTIANGNEVDNGSWISSKNDRINFFVQLEYLDGQLSDIEYQSTLTSPETIGTYYPLYFQVFGHIPSKTRLKSMHILWNTTNDGLLGADTDATSKTNAAESPKWQLLEIDIRKGIRISGSDSYQILNHINTPSTATQKRYAFPTAILTPGSSDVGIYMAYGAAEKRNKVKNRLENEIPIDLGDKPIFGFTGTAYKTATVLNRRLYIGNVKYRDPITGEFVKTNDTVFKSNVNAFDTFLYKNRIDVEINDGDDIIKLESLNGRLFQFKKKTLYVINLTRDVEYLEANLDYRGIEKDYHVVRGEGFIAWFNRYGVFMYDGEQIRELLLDKKGQKRLSSWSTNYYDPESIIGYIPEQKHIIIANNNQKVLVFDIKSQSWSYGSKRFTTNIHSNFINLDSGKLSWIEKDGSALKMRYFNPAPSYLIGSTDIDEVAFKTKDFTFDTPSINKKIIGVYINYKNGDGIVVHGFTDGSEEILARLEGSSETDFKTVRINFRDVRTEFVDEKIFNNVKNFGLRLSGTDVASNFEINDIQIIFRQKSAK
jgi:hypothetical protein